MKRTQHYEIVSTAFSFYYSDLLEAACHIGMVYHRKKLFVWPTFKVAVVLA